MGSLIHVPALASKRVLAKPLEFRKYFANRSQKGVKALFSLAIALLKLFLCLIFLIDKRHKRFSVSAH